VRFRSWRRRLPAPTAMKETPRTRRRWPCAYATLFSPTKAKNALGVEI
jgi:hypothetical protein